MGKLAIAYAVAFLVGFFCRYFDVPAPAPPVIPGVLLVVAMTLGYVAGEKIAPKKDSTAPNANSTATPGSQNK